LRSVSCYRGAGAAQHARFTRYSHKVLQDRAFIVVF
jgi:hypothetical protein